MLSSFSTSKLDQALSDRRSINEQNRQEVLAKAQKWLDRYGKQYDINCHFSERIRQTGILWTTTR
jgi:hypothetical protein